jgi:hypothetical protein
MTDTNDASTHPPLFFEKPRRTLTVAKPPSGEIYYGAPSSMHTGDPLMIDWRAFFDTGSKYNNSTAHGKYSPSSAPEVILEASSGMSTLGISWYAWLAYCSVMTMILAIVIVVGVFMFR